MRVLFVLKLVVSVGLMAWLFRSMFSRDGIDGLAERLTTLVWPWLAVAVLVHFGAVLVGTLRWRELLRARHLDTPSSGLSLGWLLRTFLIGRFFGAFTPSTTGLDGYRGIEVARRTGQAGASASVIVIEKLFGLVGMALVCATLLPFGLVQRLGVTAVLVALGMAAVAALGLFLVASPARAEAVAARAPGPIRGRVHAIAVALSGAGLDRGTVLRALSLGVLTHVLLSATFVASGYALGVSVGFLELLSVGNAIVLAVLLPVSIGGVGVREGTAVLLLSGAGVDTTDAVLLALLSYLTGQVPALLGGVLLAFGRAEPASQT
jgi:uncharacterized membrane protein YbhN (UPF0104 family)